MDDMKLLQDDAYEEMAATLQCIQIKTLNDALKANGIDDPALREAICQTYVFDIGRLLDDCWFEAEGTRVRPLLCFSSLKNDSNPARQRDVFLPTEAFSFHEYALGNISYFFEDHGEEIPDLIMGSLQNPQ